MALIDDLYAMVNGNLVPLTNDIKTAVTQTLAQMQAFAGVGYGELAWLAGVSSGPSLEDQINTVLNELAVIRANETALAAAIAALPDGSAPVVLPSPPAGYGGTTPNAVWTYIPPGDTVQMQARLANAGLYASLRSKNGNGWVEARVPIGWSVGGPWTDVTQPDPVHYDDGLVVNPTTILASDATFYDWITRLYPGLNSLPYINDDVGRFIYPQPDSGWTWRLNFGPVEFAEYKAARYPVPPLLPPVWPGLAKVTLGAPVALEGDHNLNVPMDGCLVEIDTTPDGLSTYVFGSQTSYGHIGSLAFHDDDDEMEHWQALAFSFQVYSPKGMTHATGVKWRVRSGITGLVTPWTITS